MNVAKVRPVGEKTHRIQFCMPKYGHTGYHGKHNHMGHVAHRFLVQLSYARQSTKKTPMVQLANLINYCEVYDIQNHTWSAAVGSRTHPQTSKVVLYVPLANCKRVEQLIYELRHYLSVIVGHTAHGEHVFFNTSEVQDYIAD